LPKEAVLKPLALITEVQNHTTIEVTLETLQGLPQEALVLLAEVAAQEVSLVVLLQEGALLQEGVLLQKEVLLEEVVAEDNNTK
ncbi:MAG: hypothetical protein ACI8QW_001153, partial [Saprospiraceae bacterium]